jgi:positive regulator of sigma E activity
VNQETGDESSQPASRQPDSAGKIRFYSEPPAADVYYYEYFDGGMVLTHETREAVGSPEHAVRVEVDERYGSGFSRDKLAATQTTVKDLLTSAFVSVILASLVVLTVVTDAQAALSADASISTLNWILDGLIVLAGGFMFLRVYQRFRNLYQLQGVGRSMSLTDQPKNN